MFAGGRQLRSFFDRIQPDDFLSGTGRPSS